MRQYIVVPALTLSLGLAANMYGQQADTLKRQLQIMTSEDIVLTERNPLPVQLAAPRPSKASRIQLAAEPLQNRMPALNLSPLTTLVPPIAYYDRAGQRGYLELSGGLQYNAYLAAGLRAIDKKNSQLDILAKGLYSNYRLEDYGLKRHAREQQLDLGVKYSATLASGAELALEGGIKHSKYNYYGYIPFDMPAELEALKSVIAKPELQRNTYYAGLSFGPNRPNKGLNYYVRPSIAYTQVSGLGGWEQKRNANEFHLGIDGKLSYSLDKLGDVVVDVAANNYTYSNSATILPGIGHTYSSKSLLRFSPYWSYDRSQQDVDWGLKLGIGVDMYNEHEFKGGLISPRIEAYLRFDRNWQVKLSATGGVKANSLTQMLDEMPYLRILQNAHTTRIPLDLKLALKGLVTPAVELNAELQYVKYKGAVNYLLTGTQTSAEAAGINSALEAINQQAAFTPVNADGSLLRSTIGATAQLSPYVRLMGQATYNHWALTKDADKMPTLYGRPKILLDAQLTYRPNQNVELIGGYSLKHGIQQQVVFAPHTRMMSLPALSQLSTSVAYHINKSWTLSGAAQLLLNEGTPIYYGYTAQRFSAVFGINYRF